MVLPTRLSMLYNICFNTAFILPDWKIAKVTPLPKAGNSKLVSDYRPISLLPLLSELIEKIGYIYTSRCNESVSRTSRRI